MKSIFCPLGHDTPHSKGVGTKKKFTSATFAEKNEKKRQLKQLTMAVEAGLVSFVRSGDLLSKAVKTNLNVCLLGVG